MVTSHQRCDGGDMVPRKIMNRPISAGTGTRDDSDNASDVGTTTPGTSPKKAHKCLRSNECPGPEQMERSRNSPSPQHIPELSRRKATSLQMPSVRRTTEQDEQERRIAVAMQVPLERLLNECVQLQFNLSRFPSCRSFL
uniref:(northern house mosquito) hypothetical protein n=1 Tax=Culex pipiens TaxID=7175 RepID=A0A8D8CPV5_CULPI